MLHLFKVDKELIQMMLDLELSYKEITTTHFPIICSRMMEITLMISLNETILMLSRKQPAIPNILF